MKAFIVILIILTFSFGFAANIYSQKKRIEASFCNLSLSEGIKQANASFSNSYFFRVDKNNKPVKINRISGNDFINDDEAKYCINKWIFKNFEENTAVIVRFYWKHMYGWQPISITSEGFSKTVKPNKKR